MSKLQEIPLPADASDDLDRDAGSGEVQISPCRRAFLRGLPVQESESAQLSPGPGDYRSRRIFGRDAVVLAYRYSARLAIHTVPKSDWAFLVTSTNPASDFVFNGRQCRPFDLCLSTGPDGYFSTGRDRRNIAVGIRKSRLIADCAALAGIGAEDIRLSDLVIPRERVLGGPLHRALIGLSAAPGGGPLSAGEFTMAEALENDFNATLAAQLVPFLRQRAEVLPFRTDALRVVRAATALTGEQPTAGLVDLCMAAGVSQRWLHRCFIDVIGVSPYRYVRFARLSKAHEILLAADKKPRLVKSLALSLGYRLSGRFAAEYRSVFGENPSETLTKSCKD
jgi:AraC-like DNA-binding protein